MNSDAATGYEAMKFIYTALATTKGNVENAEAFLKAMHAAKMKGIVSSSRA